MQTTLFEQARGNRIGSVDFVAADEIKVILDKEAPKFVSLNTGHLLPFPRVNSYLVVPIDERLLVGQIEWISIEPKPTMNRRRSQDSESVDLPISQRRLRINPMGTLTKDKSTDSFFFHRGANLMPSVGASVLLPTESQLQAIVTLNDARSIQIGTNPVANDMAVHIDANRLFGRHLAVLGNTGSGKSCTVAGLIRWCLETARESCDNEPPNARFIILDPNGEYAKAFGGDSEIKSRIFRAVPEEGEEALRVPLWLMNSAEWVAFTQASARTQRPTLIQALQLVREGYDEVMSDGSLEMQSLLYSYLKTTQMAKNNGDPFASFPKPKGFHEMLESWITSLRYKQRSLSNSESAKIEALIECLNQLCKSRRGSNREYVFNSEEIDTLLMQIREAHSRFGGTDSDVLSVDVDTPIPFEGSSLLKAVESVAEMTRVTEYVDTLLMRIRSLLKDTRLKLMTETASELSLDHWLTDYIGSDDSENGCVSVIDLSLVPTEVVHLLTAVIARVTFEALQRHTKVSKQTLPTVLVMEEAHTFIKRYREDSENQDAATVCCQVFERIAREGRKFGLGLVLSSQRPSELSPTVLSQCNSFLLHRISNDRDQELLRRLVPDSLRGLLRELPSLPSQHAYLLGWASELPVLVNINSLPHSQQPRSDDPDFWGVWVGINEDGILKSLTTNWKKVAEDWQHIQH